MTTPFPKGLGRSASKRTRSTESSRSGTPTPVPKALKTQADQASSGDVRVPAFLRQSGSGTLLCIGDANLHDSLGVIEIRTKFQDLEYQQMLRIAEGRSDPASNWAQDNTTQTKLRNRYQNVQPWDKSRIRLRVAPGDSDYINASPISLTDARTGTVYSYIAAQGPKQTGLSHFWHMIWQQTTDVAVIVMLTPTAESDGREKCFQYFPLDEETEAISIDPVEATEAAPVGRVKLTEVHFDEASKSTVRKLLMSLGEDSKVIWHILFSGWPDFEVPQNEDRVALFELLRLSSQKISEHSNPRIIHCSAGVGRSGSFIALEFLLGQIDSGAIADIKGNEDPIYDTVNRLREQRMTMVQNETQFAFLYEVVRERFIKSQQAPQISGIQMLPSDIAAASVKDNHEEQGKEHDKYLVEDGDVQINAVKGKAPVSV
ncbi:MAG: hypothetical protein Q9182_004149 [Xanthomendoza sp. 2 TL-2023]